MSLTYSVLYTPKNKIDTWDTGKINFLCYDKKIHIRFRDYNKEQIISGFEKKLTYLITYLANFTKISSVATSDNTKAILTYLVNTADMTDILWTISYVCATDKIRGFDLKLNYKKSQCKPFGDVVSEAFPVNGDESLKTFLETLNIPTLQDYLFDNAYSIVIHKDSEKDVNKKFTDKQARTKQVIVNDDLVKLW